ncbi:hypothetical protein [Legionella jordanis]|uniref:Uncharacterized protein n=1 Tax=Legionella jordanis TaxID=456 RepID=A0A0W0VCR1_9GAMM|nr:hypothetical protein [Legionella jordanis]KTD17911.1 hypothetical protein Ljor_2217 [Legionella jordanis]RMX02390.1 hypothetical protein EAW55_09070 [Legionella jordanis]RMX21768.1 hypothetical protein EAS68_03155 [Legionella jordanis]VEH13998.1 Uncharacterised protein [Legionella jordanis]HAT8713881.1 hypothetical protein [Legionella jordanis]
MLSERKTYVINNLLATENTYKFLPVIAYIAFKMLAKEKLQKDTLGEIYLPLKDFFNFSVEILPEIVLQTKIFPDKTSCEENRFRANKRKCFEARLRLLEGQGLIRKANTQDNNYISFRIVDLQAFYNFAQKNAQNMLSDFGIENDLLPLEQYMDLTKNLKVCLIKNQGSKRRESELNAVNNTNNPVTPLKRIAIESTPSVTLVNDSRLSTEKQSPATSKISYGNINNLLNNNNAPVAEADLSTWYGEAATQSPPMQHTNLPSSDVNLEIVRLKLDIQALWKIATEQQARMEASDYHIDGQRNEIVRLKQCIEQLNTKIEASELQIAQQKIAIAGLIQSIAGQKTSKEQAPHYAGQQREVVNHLIQRSDEAVTPSPTDRTMLPIRPIPQKPYTQFAQSLSKWGILARATEDKPSVPDNKGSLGKTNPQ